MAAMGFKWPTRDWKGSTPRILTGHFWLRTFLIQVFLLPVIDSCGTFWLLNRISKGPMGPEKGFVSRIRCFKQLSLKAFLIWVFLKPVFDTWTFLTTKWVFKWTKGAWNGFLFWDIWCSEQLSQKRFINSKRHYMRKARKEEDETRAKMFSLGRLWI